MPHRPLIRVAVIPLLALLVVPTLAGCARSKEYVRTVAQAERCKAKPQEPPSDGRRRAAQRTPVPMTPADSAKAVTMVAAEIDCTGGLRR